MFCPNGNLGILNILENFNHSFGFLALPFVTYMYQQSERANMGVAMVRHTIKSMTPMFVSVD